MLKHIDLCSGIGGVALGFEWAGLSKPVAFCDTEPWCKKILNKHWPDVPVFHDVKELAKNAEIIEAEGRDTILTAGYPCQPWSVAGKRRGTSDNRHIWPYIREIVAQKRPAWCVFENVYGHISLGLDEVLAELETDGFASRCFIVPACGVDAPHKRDRVFIIARSVAHANSQRKPDSTEHEQRLAEDVADTDSIECEGRTEEQVSGIGHLSEQFERGRQDIRKFWPVEPRILRVVNGLPNRVDRIKGLGNAIVPQISHRIGLTIKAVHDV